MGRSDTGELDLNGLEAGRVFPPGEAATSSDTALRLHLTTGEIRALVNGARLLGVPVSRLVSWAGSVNPDETVLPRWHRPFIDDSQLVHLCLMLDPGSLRVATVLAARFDIDVEIYLVARAFDWLRRIKDRHLDEKKWERVDVPAARTGWRIEGGDGTGLRLA